MEKSSNYALYIPMQSTTTAQATQRTTDRLFHYCQQSECGRDEFDTFRGEKFFLPGHQQAEPAIIRQANSANGVSIPTNSWPCLSLTLCVVPSQSRKTSFSLNFGRFRGLSQTEHQRSRASQWVADASK